jgi:hypothetical protein
MASSEEIVAIISALKEQVKALETALKGGLKIKAGKKGKKALSEETDSPAAEKVKRPMNVWQAWTRHCKAEFAEDYAIFSDAAESKQGIAIAFAGFCKTERTEEYEEFRTAFVSSPKAEAVAATPVKKAAKKAEPSAPKKAKAATAAAAVAVAAAAVVAAIEEEATALNHRVIHGKSYYMSDDGECWHMEKDESMGAWAGIYDASTDKIDATATEPEVESE